MKKILITLVNIGKLHLVMGQIVLVSLVIAAILGFPAIFMVENFGVSKEVYIENYKLIFVWIYNAVNFVLWPYGVLGRIYLDSAEAVREMVTGVVMAIPAVWLVWRIVRPTVLKLAKRV